MDPGSDKMNKEQKQSGDDAKGGDAAAGPLAEINSSRTEMLGRVQTLKKELQDWREKLDSQVKNYRQELGDLRSTLNSEVGQLRNEFEDLRNSLKRHLDNSSTTEVTESQGKKSETETETETA